MRRMPLRSSGISHNLKAPLAIADSSMAPSDADAAAATVTLFDALYVYLKSY